MPEGPPRVTKKAQKRVQPWLSQPPATRPLPGTALQQVSRMLLPEKSRRKRQFLHCRLLAQSKGKSQGSRHRIHSFIKISLYKYFIIFQAFLSIARQDSSVFGGHHATDTHLPQAARTTRTAFGHASGEGWMARTRTPCPDPLQRP